MKDVKVTCDGCERDLTTTGNSEAYRLCLKSESIPSRGGVVTDMVAFPTGITRMKHFCDVQCLVKWLQKENWYHGKN